MWLKLLVVSLGAGLMMASAPAVASGKARGESVAPSKGAKSDSAARPRASSRSAVQRRRVGSSTLLLPTLPRRSPSEAQFEDLNRSMLHQGQQLQIQHQNQFEINQLRSKLDRLH